MIKHPSQVARVAVALDLIAEGNGKWYHSTVQDGTITVTVGPPRRDGVRTFDSEEAYLVWLLSEIKAHASEAIKWFEEHHSIKNPPPDNDRKHQ